MKFNELLDAYYQARQNLTDFMVDEIKNKVTDSITFYDDDIFVSVDSNEFSEYEDMTFVYSVYVEDGVVLVDTSCFQRKFEDLHLSEQIAIFGEIKNIVQF